MKNKLLRIVKVLFALILFSSIFWIKPNTVLAGQGCCSYHGGESYCAPNGRWVCNDDTYSPTCTCNYVKTYAWDGQIYYGYSSYYTKRWNDIQNMYRDLLGRPFSSQEEGKIYADQSNKDFLEIYDEILASDEHKQYLAKTIVTAPSTDKPNKPEESNYSWLWWLLGIGGFIGVIWYANRE